MHTCALEKWDPEETREREGNLRVPDKIGGEDPEVPPIEFYSVRSASV